MRCYGLNPESQAHQASTVTPELCDQLYSVSIQFSQRGKLKLHGKLQNAGPVRSAGGAGLGFTCPAEVPAGQLPTGGTSP